MAYLPRASGILSCKAQGNLLTIFIPTTTGRSGQYRRIRIGIKTELIKYSWESETNDWVEKELNIYESDATGKSTEVITYHWEAKTHAWIEYCRSTTTYDADGNTGPQARKSFRLVEAIAETTSIPIHTWDESGSTQAALRRHKRDPLLDAHAAAVILQEYLDAQAD